MSDADRAYELAQAKIAEAARKGAEILDFATEDFRALDRLPPEIARLTELQSLGLSDTRIIDLTPLAGMTGLKYLFLTNTQITDLTPLAGLTELQRLDLDHTEITDLTPLAGLTGLQNLDLTNTQITDLTPLAGMTGLQSLDLDNTRITDLRPIKGLDKLADDHPLAGLWFNNTPATQRDARLAELAQIEDLQTRARETVDYLRSLPPWPEPYTPAATPDGSPPQPIGGAARETRIPAPKPAPLEVEVVEGKLTEKPPRTPLNDAPHARARQAWAALQDSLADLADMRPRIGNQMPALDRVLARLDAALAQAYDASNQIALGILGERVIAQAQAADEMMLASDAAELKTFAQALAVFLERFPEWKAYRDDDTAPVTLAPLPSSVLPEIDAVFDDLMARDEIDPLIPEKLREQTDDLRNEPENPRLLRGFLDSANNVFGTLAEAALAGGRWVIGEAKDFAGMSWKSVKKIGAGAVGIVAVGKATGLSRTAQEFFLRNEDALKRLAQESPADFGWLLQFLSML